jgi:F-type H+-transporting ATPase subunit delta
MPSPRLAARYAKSIVELAVEKNQLEQVYNDMLFLQAICKSNPDFVNLLKSPIVKPGKKETILTAITNGKVNAITTAFCNLLIRKSRESNLPEIITSFIDQYKSLKQIYTIQLTTATPIGDDLKKQIISKIQDQTLMKNIDLKIKVQEDLIGGFVLEMGNTLVDASIAYGLHKIKAQFLNNDFIYKIR